MKVGDLVKYVGHARLYKDRHGVVVSFLTRTHGPEERAVTGLTASDTVRVHYPGFEGQGRDSAGFGQIRDGLHPMAPDELEVISESR